MVSGEVFDLPRSTNVMPVQALIECVSESCEVAEHCERYDEWEFVSDSDFSNEWRLERGETAITSRRASTSLLCSISVREGSVSITTLRYYREQDLDGNWHTVSMTLGQGPRPRLADTEPERNTLAPASEFEFYIHTRGRKFCNYECNNRNDYVRFDGYIRGGAIEGTFTQIRPGETSWTGTWTYVVTGENTGTLKLSYGASLFSTADLICWRELTFDTDRTGDQVVDCDSADASWSTPFVID